VNDDRLDRTITFKFPVGTRFFLYTTVSRVAVGPTEPHIM